METLQGTSAYPIQKTDTGTTRFNGRRRFSSARVIHTVIFAHFALIVTMRGGACYKLMVLINSFSRAKPTGKTGYLRTEQERRNLRGRAVRARRSNYVILAALTNGNVDAEFLENVPTRDDADPFPFRADSRPFSVPC